MEEGRRSVSTLASTLSSRAFIFVFLLLVRILLPFTLTKRSSIFFSHFDAYWFTQTAQSLRKKRAKFHPELVDFCRRSVLSAFVLLPPPLFLRPGVEVAPRTSL